MERRRYERRCCADSESGERTPGPSSPRRSSRAVPLEVRALLVSPMLRGLLKCDANRRFTLQSGLRIIGVTDAMYQDTMRPLAKEVSAVLVCILPLLVARMLPVLML